MHLSVSVVVKDNTALRPLACVSVHQPLIDITSPWSRTYSAH
jgi:hypothetical protein